MNRRSKLTIVQVLFLWIVAYILTCCAAYVYSRAANPKVEGIAAELVVETTTETYVFITDTPTPTNTPTSTPSPTSTPTPTETATPTPISLPTNTPILETVLDSVVIDGEIYLGEFTLTAYCACSQCCGWSTGITASGRTVTTDSSCRTVAVDRSVISLGTYLRIDYPGFENITFRADDTGSAVNGHHIDVYFPTHSEAVAFTTTHNIPVYMLVTE